MTEQKESKNISNESPAIVINLPGLTFSPTGRFSVIAVATILSLVFILLVSLASRIIEPGLWTCG